MADSPVRILVKIGDPTTGANEVAVTASGELTTIAGANAGVNIGDIDINAFDVALTDADDDVVAGAQETLRVIGLGYGWDGSQWERITTDASGSMDVNVTLALPTGANTIGNVVLTAAGGLDALELIDDAVFADDAPFTLTTSKAMVAGVIVDATLSALAAADADVVPLRVNANGALHVTGGGGGTEFVEDTAASGGELGGLILGVRRDADTSPVTADNDYHGLIFNALGALKVEVFDGGDSLTVDSTDLGTIAGAVTGSEMQVDIVTITPDVMLGTDFSDVLGTASLVLATQADTLANTLDGLQVTAFGYNYNGATWDRVLGDATDGLLVNLGSNNDVSFTPSTLSGEAYVRTTSADVAVDATMNVDEADTGATTSYCVGFDASASVPIKVELQHVTDGTGTPVVTLFAAAGEPIHWRAPQRDYFEQLFTANAGFDGWRVVITNKDSTDAADLYGTIYTENV